MVGVIVTVVIAIGLIAMTAHYIFNQGRLFGMREAVYEIPRGVGGHYEIEGKELPKDVAEAVDQMKVAVKRGETVGKKCEQYMIHL